MEDKAVIVANLSKRYNFGEFQRNDLRLSLMNGIKSVFSSGKGKHDKKHIWALKDISFNVAKGESLGIIGENGAGKSTLLNILSEITHPTEGIVVNTRFYFNDSSIPGDGEIINWQWDFGDGSTSTARNTSHIYTSDQQFIVTLTITDENGLKDTYSVALSVAPVRTY